MEPTTIFAGGLWRAQSGYGVSTGATRDAAIAARKAADERANPTPPTLAAVSQDGDPEADGTLVPYQGPERADPKADSKRPSRKAVTSKTRTANPTKAKATAPVKRVSHG